MARCSSPRPLRGEDRLGRGRRHEESAAGQGRRGGRHAASSISSICSCAAALAPPEPLDDAGGALAAADAHRHQAVARARAAPARQQLHGELRAGGAERMPERDGAAVDVRRAPRRGRAARTTATTCAAKASFSSIRPMSSRRQAGLARARVGIGLDRADAHDLRAPRPRSRSDTKPPERRRGPAARRARRSITTMAAAPSLICELLPAVTRAGGVERRPQTGHLRRVGVAADPLVGVEAHDLRARAARPRPRCARRRPGRSRRGTSRRPGPSAARWWLRSPQRVLVLAIDARRGGRPPRR